MRLVLQQLALQQLPSLLLLLPGHVVSLLLALLLLPMDILL
jgi:hypothetical protein